MKLKTRRQRACAGFAAFFFVLAKGTVSNRDLERLGFTHPTSVNTIRDLVAGGSVGGRGSSSYATLTDQMMANLHAYIEENPKARWAAANGVVKVLGLDNWPPESRENFYRLLKEWVDDAGGRPTAEELPQIAGSKEVPGGGENRLS